MWIFKKNPSLSLLSLFVQTWKTLFRSEKLHCLFFFCEQTSAASTTSIYVLFYCNKFNDWKEKKPYKKFEKKNLLRIVEMHQHYRRHPHNALWIELNDGWELSFYAQQCGNEVAVFFCHSNWIKSTAQNRYDGHVCVCVTTDELSTKQLDSFEMNHTFNNIITNKVLSTTSSSVSKQENLYTYLLNNTCSLYKYSYSAYSDLWIVWKCTCSNGNGVVFMCNVNWIDHI